MESNSFIKEILQNNDNWDLRKLSLQSVSTNLNQMHHKGIILIEPPSYHSQLPTFINRKVKNLKPYTNHFKRFNNQNQKVNQRVIQNKRSCKVVNVISQGEKIKEQKYSMLKQLGIQNQIKSSDIRQKFSQISVYDQFLEKTNTLLSSNILQEMYRQTLKRSEKLNNDHYQRSHRLNNQIETHQKSVGTKQLRRSIGGANMNKQKQIRQKQQKTSSTHRIKSMNQLPKSQEVSIKNDNVCIIPSLLKPHDEDLMFRKGIKYVESLRLKKQLTITASESNKKQDHQKTNACVTLMQKQQKQIEDNLIEDLNPSNQQKKLKVSIKQSLINESQKQIRESVEKKNSPTKYQKNLVNLNYPISSSPEQKLPKPTPFTNKKSQKEVTTINIDKIRQKSSQPQFSQLSTPPNITAFSYIVYQPSFSQNSNQNLYAENLANTSKLFSNNRVLAAVNCKTVVQIASLTKIMTFLISLQICERLQLQMSKEKVRVGKFQANINGTSAEIKEGEIYSVEQLFYGLMLPSGNDASLALATWAGKKLLIHEIKEKRKNKKKLIPEISTPKISVDQQVLDSCLKAENQKIVLKKKKCYDRFILEMNKKARCLGMMKTSYANSHGLSNNLNKSCAFDLCILCEYAMTKQQFRKVVSTKEYKSTILYQQLVQDSNENENVNVHNFKSQNSDDIQHENYHSDEESTQSYEQKQQPQAVSALTSKQTKTISPQNKQPQKVVVFHERQISWQNTHQLLTKEEYIGIKTGMTNTAGPCLASCIKTKENRSFIIIVLNSKKISYRFKDTQALRKWIYKRQNIEQPKQKRIEIQPSQTHIKNFNIAESEQVVQKS